MGRIRERIQARRAKRREQIETIVANSAVRVAARVATKVLKEVPMYQPSKSAKKGIIAAVASGVALAAVGIVKAAGDSIGLPPGIVEAAQGWIGDAVSAGVTGVLLGALNWVKHRKG